MRAAAFLDRDGTINENVDWLTDRKDIILIPGAAEGIKLLNEKQILVVVITNQPVVARGMATEDDVHKMNARLATLLEEKGARIDAFYFCPHHPETNHPEANDPKYRRDCDCRKPKPGMFRDAARTHNIDLAQSFMVGDKTIDIAAGKAAGCSTILVQTGSAGNDGKEQVTPDHICKTIKEACELIIKK
jgi:mannose-1-phosphate guanylyltransferase / phosphomannomutase